MIKLQGQPELDSGLRGILSAPTFLYLLSNFFISVAMIALCRTQLLYMSKLLALRQKLNLTQEDLFDKTGISVRTIQRIEAGTSPKGYTLKALAKGLGVSEDELIEKEEAIRPVDTKWLKLINLSSLPFMFIPPLNIAAPLIIMYYTKEFTPVTKKIVTIQIVWTFIAALLFLTVVILNDWFAVRSKYMMLIPAVWLLVNTLVILLNAAQTDKTKTLRISTNFGLI